MNTDEIIQELEDKRDTLTGAINALKGRTNQRGPKPGRRGGLSDAVKRRMSLAMKKRWAERKKAGKKAL
jgi:hypothetical protein